MSATDVLRKEAHELMYLAAHEPHNVLVANKSSYNERLSLCVDGELASYIHSFKLQIKELHESLQISLSKLQDTTLAVEELKRVNEGLSATLDTSNKLHFESEKKVADLCVINSNLQKSLDESHSKYNKSIDIITNIRDKCLEVFP